MSFFKSRGDGTFESTIFYGTGKRPENAVCVDFDGDGDMDLAVANRSSDDFYIMFNRSILTRLENGIDLPRQPSLLSAYPNPFNAQTTISYTLPEPGEVSLIVYNLLGQRVGRLYEGMRPAGEHRALWDAAAFPSGIYFARLEAGGVSQTAKMVLLK